MNTPTRPARAGRLLRTSAFAVTLAGVVAVGVALPATAANAATPAPSLSRSAPGTLPPRTPRTLASRTPGTLPARAPRTLPSRAPGSRERGRTLGAPATALPVEPHGGVDTGAGGSQPDARSGADVAVPVAAGGAGVGALAGFGLWRRRRAGARG
jgi:hypothetical protein